MDELTIDRALELADTRGGHRVSLFMPTRPFVPGAPDENGLRLKNLLRTAEGLLAEHPIRPGEIEKLLEPARTLIDDRPFWMRAEQGLALLIGPEGMHAFRLSAPVQEQVRVNHRYYLRPLLPHVETRGRYWVLFISQKSVRLYQGTGDGLAEVPSDELPHSLSEALAWDDFEKTSLQFHGPNAAAGRGRTAPIYHGNKEPDVKNELARFFRQIDAALVEKLRGERAPLVLAGVDYLIPIYRDVNTYPHLVHEAVTGNAEILPLPELHAKALAALHRLAEDEGRQLAEQAEDAWGSSLTTPDPETIVPAAFLGRVDTLFLTEGDEWWGRYDPSVGKAILHRAPVPGDEDLLDLAALQTLEKGGAVVNLPPERMPRGQTAVALLRY